VAGLVVRPTVPAMVLAIVKNGMLGILASSLAPYLRAVASTRVSPAVSRHLQSAALSPVEMKGLTVSLHAAGSCVHYSADHWQWNGAVALTLEPDRAFN
jgi:hypothetical protein